MAMQRQYVVEAGPLGLLLLVAENERLVGLHFQDPGAAVPAHAGEPGSTALLREAQAQLRAYFDGRLRDFDLALAAAGTAFQKRVWASLCAIPYGTTISYTQLANAAGSPRGFRAVGQANGSNPIAVIVPCHRVIAADGTLGGYGGGLERKRLLLELEGALRP